MDADEIGEQVEAARAYENLFVPALFGQWSERLVALADLAEEFDCLDVACGTGALTRAIAEKTKRKGRLVGMDLNLGMLAVARESEPTVQWVEGAAESLPFEDASFDRVFCQFGLMFFRDRVAALKEMRRVTGINGKTVIAVWDSLEKNPTYEAEANLFERLVGEEAGAAVRAPFALGDLASLESICKQAGWTRVSVTREKGTARFLSVREMLEADLSGWLPVMGVHLEEEKIQEVLNCAGDVLPGDGLAAFQLSALLLVLE